MSGRLTSMARFNEDIPDSSVITQCAACGSEITAGMEVFRIDDNGGFVHEWCAADYAMERMYDANGIIGADGNIE